MDTNPAKQTFHKMFHSGSIYRNETFVHFVRTVSLDDAERKDVNEDTRWNEISLMLTQILVAVNLSDCNIEVWPGWKSNALATIFERTAAGVGAG